MPVPANPSDYFLDPRRVRRRFDAASDTFDQFGAVHTEIRTRLIERLEVVRIQPAIVLDLGAGTGLATRALKRRYRAAHVIALDLSSGMLRRARSGLFQRFSRIVADAQSLPLADTSIDLIFSNLMLQWISNPDAAIAEARRVLKPEGLFTFTSLGPDSLQELRRAWGQADDRPHVHAFIDMHDLGDALLRAGFVEPVMDTERLTVTYPSWTALRTELRGSGSTNIMHARPRSLTGRAAVARAYEALAAAQTNDVISLTLEVVYGHAWAGTTRSHTKRSDEVRIPVGGILKRR